MKRSLMLVVFGIFLVNTAHLISGLSWASETRVVNAFDSNEWFIDTTEGKTIYIYFQVYNGSDISLRVFDSFNYVNWSNGLYSESIIERINQEQDSIAFFAESINQYYIILDNKDNSNSVDVEVIIQDSPISSGSFEGTPTIITLIVFGSIFTAGIVVLAVILLRKKLQSKEVSLAGSTSKVKGLQNEKTSKVEGLYCPNCKKKCIDVEEYCSYCGHRIYKKP